MLLKNKAFTLVELLVVVTIIGVLMAVLVPALRSAWARGRAVTCQSNVRKNNQILLEISRDNSGVLNLFRDGAGGFNDRAFYMIGDRLYEGQERPRYTPELAKTMHCPEMPRPKTPFLECYGVNFASHPAINAIWSTSPVAGANLSSLRVDLISSPAQFALLMDSLAPDGREVYRVNHGTNYPALRHERRCNAAFADGHAASIPLSDFPDLAMSKAYLWRSERNFEIQTATP